MLLNMIEWPVTINSINTANWKHLKAKVGCTVPSPQQMQHSATSAALFARQTWSNHDGILNFFCRNPQAKRIKEGIDQLFWCLSCTNNPDKSEYVWKDWVNGWFQKKQMGQIKTISNHWNFPSSASPLPLDKSWRVYLKAMCLVLSVDDTLPLSQKSGASSRIMWMQLVLCKRARKIQDGKFHEISKRCWMLAVDTLSKTKRTILQFWVEAVPSLRPLWLVSLVSSVHPMHRKSRSDPSSETDSKGIFHLHSLDRVNLNFLSVDRWLPGAAATAIKSYKIAL